MLGLRQPSLKQGVTGPLIDYDSDWASSAGPETLNVLAFDHDMRLLPNKRARSKFPQGSCDVE